MAEEWELYIQNFSFTVFQELKPHSWRVSTIL
jgi:hypothetical protein